MGVPTAEEAYLEAMKVRREVCAARAQKEKEHLDIAIPRAVKAGGLHVVVLGILTTKTSEELRRAGYRVEVDYSMSRGNYTKISWTRPL